MSKLFGPEGHLSLGALNILPVHRSIQIPELGSLNFAVKAVEVSGLNSWSNVLVEALTAQTVSYNLSLERLVVNVSLELSVVPDPHGLVNGTTLDEEFELTFLLGDLRLAGGAFLAINKSQLGLLSIDQLAQAGCSAPAVYSAMVREAGLTAMPLTLSVQPASSAGSLEMDIDHMINVVLTMLLGQYSETIEAVVEHATEVNMTDAVNQWVRDQTDLATLSTCRVPVDIHTSPGSGEAAGTASSALPTAGALQGWLASLSISVPSVSYAGPDWEISITGIYCDGIRVGGVETNTSGAGEVTIQGKGLKATCHFDCFVDLYGSGFSGPVSVYVADATLGSPVRIDSSSGYPPLPDKVEAYDCPKNTEFVDIVVVTESPVASAVMSELILLVKSSVESAACAYVDDEVRTKGTAALQKFSREIRTFMTENPTSIVPSLPEPHQDFIDFAANPAMELVNQITVHILDNASSQFSLNAIMSKLFGPEGHLSLGALNILPVHRSIQIPELGSLNFAVKAVEVSGLNSWSNVLVEALTAQTVSYNLSLERLVVNVSLELSVVPDPHGLVNGTTLDEEFELTFLLGDLRLAGGAFLAINKSQLGLLSIDQLAQAGCSAPAVYSAMVREAGLTAMPLTLSVQPASSAGSLEMDIDHMINVVLTMLLGQYSETIEAVVEHAVTDAVNEWVHNQMALATLSACPAPVNTYTSPIFGEVAGMASLVLLAAGALGLVAGTVKYLARGTCFRSLRAGGAKVEIHSVCRGPGERSAGANAALAEMPASRLPGAWCAEDKPPWDCLGLHPSVSTFTMFSLPILVVADIALFLQANFGGPGVSVRMAFEANGGQVVQLPSVSFTLIGSIVDMWNGKAYPLALLVGFFSGIWPYVKLLAMLCCWLMPVRKESRQAVLKWLDALGKWSLVDVFVMVLFMVAFEFDLSVAEQAPQAIKDAFDEFGGSARLLVYVHPEWGFYVFVFATLGSLVLGHIMTMVQRRAYEVAEFGIGREGPRGRTRLCNVQRPEGQHAGRAFVYGPICALAFSLLLVLVGLDVKAFQFKFLGLSGLALGEEGSVRPFSVVSLASEVPRANLHPRTPDLLWIQFVFCLFSMLMVIAHHALLMVLWAVPFASRWQRRGLVAAQVMSAWNALDVLVVSILAAVLEIRQFALFILGDKCDALDALLESIPPIASRLPGSVTCFDVRSELREGFFVLLAAAVVSSIVSQVVLRMCSAALDVDKVHGTPADATAAAGLDEESRAAGPADGGPQVQVTV